MALAEPEPEPVSNEADRRGALWALLAADADVPDLPSGRPSWHAHAACHGRGDLMFSTDRRRIAEAKELCRRCPAQERCARDALERGEKYGVWGGLAEGDRRSASRQRH